MVSISELEEEDLTMKRLEKEEEEEEKVVVV